MLITSRAAHQVGYATRSTVGCGAGDTQLPRFARGQACICACTASRQPLPLSQTSRHPMINGCSAVICGAPFATTYTSREEAGEEREEREEREQGGKSSAQRAREDNCAYSWRVESSRQILARHNNTRCSLTYGHSQSSTLSRTVPAIESAPILPYRLQHFASRFSHRLVLRPRKRLDMTRRAR